MKTLCKALLLALIAGVSAWWAIRFTRGPSGLSTLWPASGIVCGVMLTSPRSRWPIYLLAALVAFVLLNLLAHGPTPAALPLSLANTLDALVVALVVSRGVDDITNPAHIRRATLFASAGTTAACVVSACIAAAVLSATASRSFGELWVAWFASHALGMVIFATLTVVVRGEGWRVFEVSGRRIALLSGLILLALVCWVVFESKDYMFPFLIFLPHLLVAFRHRFSGFVLGTALVAVIAASEHALGRGPFMLMGSYGELGQTLALQAFIASACLLALPVAVVLTGRDALARRLAKSEREYRMLADYSRDMVVRFDANGVRRYVSPSATEMLGWSRGEFTSSRWDLVHPDDVAGLQHTLADLLAHGGSVTSVFRIRHKDGHYVWIEANAVRAPGLVPGGSAEVIYSGRDISKRVAAQKALQDNQRRLRAITDNLPAIVMHIDKDERYTFVNAYTLKTLGIEAEQLVGRSVRGAMGEAVYAEIEPYMRAALRGETSRFEIERDFFGKPRYYQSTYVPDVGEDGTINGFYAVSFDITELKQAQSELLRLARYDPLTGVANRLHFIERLELAIARSHRSTRPIALLYLDLDHFKQINDTLGHAAGDQVLCEFARRLRQNVRDVDLVARMGGDEFVVVLEEIDSPGMAQAIAGKLIDCLDNPIPIDGAAPVRIGASVGIAFSGHPVEDAETLLSRADAALYDAKRAGRNVWRMAG